MVHGYSRGGASFRRLEGCYFADGKAFFTSTEGGPNSDGQVWEYDTVNEKLRLIYNSQSAIDCENPDNIVVAPNGALLLQEGNSGPTINDGERRP